MKVYDVLCDQDGDLKFVNGDFDLGFSDEQHIQDIITAFKGHWKQHPTIGVGISLFINSSSSFSEISREIRINLEADNYEVSKIELLDNGQIYIDAKRIR